MANSTGVRKRLNLFQKLLFLWAPDLILELELERRVFQSKLGVSSINQCNITPLSTHWAPRKKIQEGYNLFRTSCIWNYITDNL
jgi:hypothetical protein